MLQYHTIASVYGSNTYDSSNYNGALAIQGSSGGSTSGSSAGGANGKGMLTDTGIALAAVVTLACLIMLAAMIVKVWRRPKTIQK
jgi:hypothetical protein